MIRKLEFTYPKVLQRKSVWRIWKKTFCKRGWHLWDQCISDKNELFCDACERTITICTE